MTKRSVAAVVAILALALLGLRPGCRTSPASSDPPAAASAPAPTPEPAPIRARLTVAGDLVPHLGINDQALADGNGVYDYAPMFRDIQPYIADADYASCCLETTFLGDENYMGYPLFRSPDALAASLAEVGFDLIATASNHALDAWDTGLRRTLDVLDEAGLEHVGTYRSQAERDANRGIHVADVGGIRIAFLDYTYGTNGLPKTGYEYAVNTYYTDYMTSFQNVDYDLVSADMAAARALDADLIAVIVHWGIEYKTVPNSAQTDFADYLFAQGADLVLGGHPHVPQSMEMRTVTDADGTQRRGFVCYCLGNLLSTMNDNYTYLTALLQIDLEKDATTGETTILDAGYIPAVLLDLQDYGVQDGPWRYRLWDLYAAAADYAAGDDRGVMDETMYTKFLGYIQSMQDICGADYDLHAREAAQP